MPIPPPPPSGSSHLTPSDPGVRQPGPGLGAVGGGRGIGGTPGMGEGRAPPVETFQPIAALLAILLPGAGHLYLGQPRRARLIALGILGLFVAGLLIGGVDVIDRTRGRLMLAGRDVPSLWFIGQALVGPLTFGVDYLHQNLKVIDPADGSRRTPRPELRDAEGRILAPAEVRGPGGLAVPAQPGQPPPYSRSLGRMNELGMLFITIAGMLNLIAIIDAAFFARGGGVGGRRASDRSIENARRFMEARARAAEQTGDATVRK